MSLKTLLLTLCAVPALTALAYPGQPELNYLDWPDYISEEILQDFEQETGIRVNHVTFDTNEALIAALNDPNRSYDLINTPLFMLKKFKEEGLLMPLDKSLLRNLYNLDLARMAKISEIDPGNEYGIPYSEISTGIAYNPQRIREVTGENLNLDSWAAIFEPENARKLSQCGLSFLNSPSDMFCTALIYMNRDPERPEEEDLAAATELLSAVIPYTRRIENDEYAQALASGQLCASVSWSGDSVMADHNLRAQGGSAQIKFVIPKEGAIMGFDMLAIPANAQNPDAAHRFLDFILRADISARITGYSFYLMANRNAAQHLSAELRDNAGINFPSQILRRMHIVIPDNEVIEAISRAWQDVERERR